MLATIGAFFAEHFRRWLPDAFIFACLLTLLTGALALGLVVDLTMMDVLCAWEKGFWSLLSFAMQMILILVTGFAIAISPPVEKLIDRLAHKIKTPNLVYFLVVFIGCVFTLISWGWIVLTAILARELAKRVPKVDYRLLTACVYVSFLPWHGGLSGSIPLLLNTPDNFMIQAGILEGVISTHLTLLSPMNLVCNGLLLMTLPLIMIAMKPSDTHLMEFQHLRDNTHPEKLLSIEEEVNAHCLSSPNVSDALNNSRLISLGIIALGSGYLVWYFTQEGFQLNLNIMILLFLMLGMILHATPVRYVTAVKRASQNVSDIILQFPFYAGIMGILQFTGLGLVIAEGLTSFATLSTLPVITFLVSGIVNIFVPSGGGEWAVIGPPLLETAQTLGAHLSEEQLTNLLAKVSMATAYGDAWTNMIQPFWTLAFFPIIASGIRMKPRDIMGYTFVALLWSGVVFAGCVMWVPV